MCKGKGMNVLVMDVEGTDGRERGEDQVSILLLSLAHPSHFCHRISSANPHYSLSHRPKSLL